MHWTHIKGCNQYEKIVIISAISDTQHLFQPGEYTRSAPPLVRPLPYHLGDRGATHALTGRAQALPAATATATGLLTKVGSDLDAACGEVGAAVASDVPGEYTRTAPPFVRFHIT